LVRPRLIDYGVIKETCRAFPRGVTAGCGLVQSWGGPIETIRPGDVAWIPPGQKPWHGATATTAMTHIAIVEQLDGKSVEWMEKVSDEQYQAGSRAE
jgi:hypothetical protein